MEQQDILTAHQDLNEICKIQKLLNKDGKEIVDIIKKYKEDQLQQIITSYESIDLTKNDNLSDILFLIERNGNFRRSLEKKFIKIG